MTTSDSWKLSLPDQDLARLTIGSDSPRKLAAWVKALPPLNLGESARQLYQYLRELNRLPLKPSKRLALLEVLLPAIDHVSQELGKHYLGKPLILPEKAHKVATLAQALQGHLANGYKLAAVQSLAKIKQRDARKQLVLACYRGIAALTRALLRCYQLYFSIPPKLWLEMHQLYKLAEHYQLHNIKGNNQKTVEDAYCRALLLATARPNQLRQQEIRLVYQLADKWSAWADLQQEQTDDTFYVVTLDDDRGPVCRTQLEEPCEHCRYLNMQPLVQQLGQLAAEEGSAVPNSLLMLLQHNWGTLSERSFQRASQSGHLELCLGLAAVHYVVAGEQSFQHFIHNDQPRAISLDDASDNPFNHQEHPKANGNGGDPWAQVLNPTAQALGDHIDFSDVSSSLLGDGSESKSHVDVHLISKKNASPGGYCLSWPGETPIQLRTGEMVALRDGHSDWAVGVIRWVRQTDSSAAEFGVEVIAPRAEPCAARPIRKTGEDATFLRALLLPAIETAEQPITLLLPAIGFQAKQRIELLQSRQSSRLILGEPLSGSASHSLYRLSDAVQSSADVDSAPVEAASADATSDGFDSIWSRL